MVWYGMVWFGVVWFGLAFGDFESVFLIWKSKAIVFGD